MYDIFYISDRKTDYFYEIKTKFPLLKHVTSMQLAQQRCLTEFFWVVWDNLIVDDAFEFDYMPDDWSKEYIHTFLNDTYYDGIVLCPKSATITDKEIDHRFFINKKEVKILASVPKKYDVFEIDSYDEYQAALDNSTTEMFWMSSRNISATIPDMYFSYNNSYDRKINHAFVHQVGEQSLYNGLFLCSKHAPLTKREIEHRHPVNRKEWPIVGSTAKKYDVFEIDSYDEYQAALDNSKTEMFWMSSRNISATIPEIYFDHSNNYDRNTNHAFVHQVGEQSLYNGLFLCSKHAPLTKREIEHRHIVNRKEWSIIGSTAKKYDVFEIDSYDEYQAALDNSKTEMFWMSSRNISATIPEIYFDHSNSYDRKINHGFIHQVKDRALYNGLFLCSKHAPLTKKEVEHRHIVNRKEWNIVGSGPVQYEIFYTTKYEDYLNALQNSKTEMFWIIPNYVKTTDRFKFDTYFSFDQKYERTINHVYLNGKYHDGIVLCSKQSKFSKREFEYKFISHKNEVNIVISTPTPFDIVFISYQEPNADENFNYLLDRFPHAKRVHGVKGIHQAHIAAAKLCNTDMFWIVDGDALIDQKFNFDYQVARWDKEMVHVWRSINPINDLVYGYGGVKLFPTELTINMDTSKPDMTTSISSKFKAVQEISNITGFNTDPFNTWKSAFRECVKLSSKVIDRQKDDETQSRLQIWCTQGKDRPYGIYAIDGAKMGALYGARYQNNKEKLRMINDFNWLKEQFNARNI